MKNINNAAAADHSAPYRTNKAGLIKAPKSVAAGDPKVKRIDGKGDLRGGKG